MKILLVSMSPKKKFSNSKYFLSLLKWQLNGHEVVEVNLRGAKDYARIFEHFNEIDALVLSMPVYVDAVPSHVLEFLTRAEAIAKEQRNHFRVYAVTNCGFYEGHQCSHTLAMLQCWCKRASLSWCGGIGIGAGEMLGCIRIMPIIAILIPLLQFTISSISLVLQGNFTFHGAISSINVLSIFINIALFLFFNIGLFLSIGSLKKSIKKKKIHTEAYTTVWCPSFLFVLFADLFWIIRAAFHKKVVWQMYQKH